MCAEGQGNINRAHVAAILTKKGYTSSRNEAFRTVLAPERGFYIEPDRLPVFETIDFIRSIGAVPVLAHPFLNLDEERLRVFLPQAKERGLLGMEVAYSTYDDATAACAARLAQEFGLLPSGGSDYHGAKKADIKMGVGRGNLKVPAEWVDRLK